MNKSAIFGIVFLIALLSFMIWKGYLQLPTGTAKLDAAIPANTAFTFKIDALNSTLNQLETAKFKNDLEKMSWYRQLIDGLNLIQALTNEETNTFLAVNAAYSYLKNEEGNFLFAVSSQNIPKQAFKFFRKIITNSEEVVETNKVGNTTMYSADVHAKGFSNLTFAFRKGIILFSRKPELVKSSLVELNTLSGDFAPALKKPGTAIKTIQTGFTLNFTEDLIKGFSLKGFDELQSLNAKLYLFDNGIIANGALKVKQNTKLNILAKHSNTAHGDILEFVPAKASYFEKYKVDDLLSYVEHQLEYESTARDASAIDFTKCIGNEWVYLKYDANSSPFFIFSIKDVGCIAEHINTESDKIQAFELNEILELLKLAETPKGEFYYKLNNDVLMIGSDKDILKKMFKEVEAGKNFLSKKAFQQYEPKLYENNFCLVYSNSIKASVKNNFGPVFYQFFTIDNAIFANGVFAFKNEGIANKVNFEHQPTIASSQNYSSTGKWEKIIGRKIVNGPDKFKNHYTNQKEYVLQDDKNNLYLIDKKDSILWKKKLENTYLGNITAVDFYKNKKWQILLNTKNAIYLIDRKGRNVENFPVKLEDGATNALTKVTYADAGKVRYYLATKLNALRAYDKNGKSVKGWKLPELSGEVKLPVTHFIANNKDYLCAVTKNGTIHLFSRDGSIRQQAIETNLKNASSMEITGSGNNILNISNDKETKTININQPIE